MGYHGPPRATLGHHGGLQIRSGRRMPPHVGRPRAGSERARTLARCARCVRRYISSFCLIMFVIELALHWKFQRQARLGVGS
jgi:hypothetical protein